VRHRPVAWPAPVRHCRDVQPADARPRRRGAIRAGQGASAGAGVHAHGRGGGFRAKLGTARELRPQTRARQTVGTPAVPGRV